MYHAPRATNLRRGTLRVRDCPYLAIFTQQVINQHMHLHNFLTENRYRISNPGADKADLQIP